MGRKYDIPDQSVLLGFFKKAVQGVHVLFPGFQAEHAPHMIKVNIVGFKPLKRKFQPPAEILLCRMVSYIQCAQICLRCYIYIASFYLG